MSTVSETAIRIQQALEARHAQRGPVEDLLHQWRAIDGRVRGLTERVQVLRDALQQLEEHDEHRVQLTAALDGFTDQLAGDIGLRRRIADDIERINAVYERVCRPTVNIGVSGQTKAGKSTLLKAIAGLDDRHIPARRHRPTTAVRSKLYHSTTEEHAQLLLYTYEEFREAVLAPHHELLGLPSAPATVELFERFRYPSVEELRHRAAGDPELERLNEETRFSSEALLRRLHEMQAALGSYHKLFTRRTMRVHLDELEPYVAYPDDPDPRVPAAVINRPYLAVKEVRITCRFDDVDVDHLGLIDLPGLGELGVQIDERHVAGLQNEVDLVLFVKRPDEQKTEVLEADYHGLDLTYKARSGVSARDFVFVVVNHDRENCDAATLDAAVSAVQRAVNREIEDEVLRVLVADVSRPQEVSTRVLQPVLRHLASRLAAMDRDAMNFTLAQCHTTCTRIRSAVSGLLDDLRRPEAALPSPEDRLSDLVERLRAHLASDLSQLAKGYLDASAGGPHDREFDAAIQEAKAKATEWVAGGLGYGDRATWVATVEKDIPRDELGTVKDRQCEQARLHLSNTYKRLDGRLAEPVRELRARIATVIRQRFAGELVPQPTDPNALRDLRELLDHEECPALADAVRDVVDLEIRYGSLLLPILRPHLTRIRAEELDPGKTRTPGSTGEEGSAAAPTEPSGSRPAAVEERSRLVRRRLPPPDSVATTTSAPSHASSTAECLYQDLTELVMQVIERMDAELRTQSAAATRVLHAAADQFADHFTHSPNGRNELYRLCKPRSRLIWPEEFTQGVVKVKSTIIGAKAEAQETLKALAAAEAWSPPMPVTSTTEEVR